MTTLETATNSVVTGYSKIERKCIITILCLKPSIRQPVEVKFQQLCQCVSRDGLWHFYFIDTCKF